MNEKFTKGKWVSDDGYAVIVEGSGAYVGWPPADGAICSLNDGEYIENNNNYDAYLIAAAPEMYETLSAILRDDIKGVEMCQVIESVLSRARGES